MYGQQFFKALSVQVGLLKHEMSEEWEYLTTPQCFHDPNPCNMLNILIMYKVNNEISYNLILVFYVIEAKSVMAEWVAHF